MGGKEGGECGAIEGDKPTERKEGKRLKNERQDSLVKGRQDNGGDREGGKGKEAEAVGNTGTTERGRKFPLLVVTLFFSASLEVAWTGSQGLRQSWKRKGGREYNRKGQTRSAWDWAEAPGFPPASTHILMARSKMLVMSFFSRPPEGRGWGGPGDLEAGSM